MSRPRSALVLGLAIPLLAIGCGAGKHAAATTTAPAPRTCPPVSKTGSTVIPNVVGTPFDNAVSELSQNKLLASVAHFPPFSDPFNYSEGWLENYVVASQSPQAGQRATAGKPVALTLTYNKFEGPSQSPEIPAEHPDSAEVPNLVGLDYMQALDAEKSADGPDGRSGVFVLVGKTGPLTADASRCGVNAFIVTAQTPKAGSTVPWGGVKGTKVTPKSATVTVTLAGRPPTS